MALTGVAYGYMRCKIHGSDIVPLLYLLRELPESWLSVPGGLLTSVTWLKEVSEKFLNSSPCQSGCKGYCDEILRNFNFLDPELSWLVNDL